MKTNRKTIRWSASLCLIASLAVLGSCKSDPTGPGLDAGMSCKINGATWSTTTISKSGFDPGALIVGLRESGGLTETLGLDLDTIANGRTIQLKSDSVSFNDPTATLSRSDGVWRTRNGSGTVTITALTSSRVTGTFSFTLYKNGVAGAETLVVTEGRFDSPY